MNYEGEVEFIDERLSDDQKKKITKNKMFWRRKMILFMKIRKTTRKKSNEVNNVDKFFAYGSELNTFAIDDETVEG